MKMSKSTLIVLISLLFLLPSHYECPNKEKKNLEEDHRAKDDKNSPIKPLKLEIQQITSFQLNLVGLNGTTNNSPNLLSNCSSNTDSVIGQGEQQAKSDNTITNQEIESNKENKLEPTNKYNATLNESSEKDSGKKEKESSSLHNMGYLDYLPPEDHGIFNYTYPPSIYEPKCIPSLFDLPQFRKCLPRKNDEDKN